MAEKIVLAVKAEVEKCMELNVQPVIICSPVLRRQLRKLVEQTAPSVFVTSHAEIVQNVNTQSVGKVTSLSHTVASRITPLDKQPSKQTPRLLRTLSLMQVRFPAIVIIPEPDAL